MSLNKAIEHGREHRTPYRGPKVIDYTCRNHGSCPWCAENRKHKFRDKSYTPAEQTSAIQTAIRAGSVCDDS